MLRVSRLVPALFLLLSLSSGCNVTVEEICGSKLPEMKSSLDNAITVLKDWRDAGRSIASGERPALADYDRKSWQRWAQGHLDETQKYLDRIRDDARFRGARNPLTEMANGFVAFHGAAADSKVPVMIRSLERIRTGEEKIAREVCRKLQ